MPSSKPRRASHAVIVDPLRHVDAQIREAEAQIAKLRAVDAACTTFDEAVTTGAAALKLIGPVEQRLAELKQRRIRIIAGLPLEDGPPPAPPATPEPPRPVSVQLPPIAKRLKLGKSGDEPEEDVRVSMSAAADFLEQIDEIARKVWGDKADRLVSVTRGHMSGLDFGVALLRSLQTAADLREKALEARIAELEARVEGPIARYVGVWRDGTQYEPGQMATHGGQTWHCNTQTTDRPDGGSNSWVLCSRRGRDGRDADVAPLLRLIEDKFSDLEARLKGERR